jgi:hypothetical protein
MDHNVSFSIIEPCTTSLWKTDWFHKLLWCSFTRVIKFAFIPRVSSIDRVSIHNRSCHNRILKDCGPVTTVGLSCLKSNLFNSLRLNVGSSESINFELINVFSRSEFVSLIPYLLAENAVGPFACMLAVLGIVSTPFVIRYIFEWMNESNVGVYFEYMNLILGEICWNY